MPNFSDLLRSMNPDSDEPDHPKISREGEIAVLQDALAFYDILHRFSHGDLVRCKTNNKIFNLSDNELGIFIQYLPEPITADPYKHQGNYFHFDCIVGSLDQEQNLRLLYVDSRRLELAPGP